MRGFKIKIQIWDTVSQERFICITKKHYPDANGVLFLFDLTKKII